jgi:hypothetical protein
MMKVAFYKSTRLGLRGIYNRLVRGWECGRYSHCELIFGDGLSASSSFEDGGVRFKRIEFHPDRWDIIEVPWADELFARAWFIRNEGKAYNIIGNLHFLVGFILWHDDKKFCSQAILESLGIEDAWRFGPNAAEAMIRSINKRVKNA